MILKYNEYRDMLIHKPERQWTEETNIVYEETFAHKTPTFSVVIPIHNQNDIIQIVLSSVILNTVGNYELILILDGCTDDSKTRVLEWLDNIRLPQSCGYIVVLENPFGIFETSCDNMGFVNSRGKYIIEIQADMKIVTYGYNVLLTRPMEIYPDIIGVSGRCCHTLNGTPGINVGKLGEKVLQPHQATFDNDIVYLSHTVNRGPLALRNSMLKEIGYLDEEHYVLGDDEHDLFTRAWNDKKWRSGFVPVEVYSPLEWGSTRKPMPSDVREYVNKRFSKMKEGFLGKYRQTFLYPPGETRRLSLSEKILSTQTLCA